MKLTSKRRSDLTLLLIANLIFVVLYAKFIAGSAVYLYTDIGSDSYTSSLPILGLLHRLIAGGSAGGYSLTYGLGTDTTSLMVKYLNPLKAPLLLFGRLHLDLGLLLEMFLQTNVLAFFSYRFMQRLLKEERAAFFAALSWTFSGYITLWSQNLTTGSCMAAFTVVMAAMLLLMEEPGLRSALLMILSLAISLITNYYYSYMTAYFALFFLLFYSVAKSTGLKAFFLNGFRILGCALVSAALAAIALLPSFTGFSGSVRTGSTVGIFHGIEYIPMRQVLTTLGRLFSVNFFGAGPDYAASVNYYEQAALSTTLLFGTAVLYLLLIKKTRLLTLAALILSAAMLYSKNIAALLQFNRMVQRYSFMMTFASAIAVGIFVAEILTAPDRKKLKAAAILGLVLQAVAMAGLKKIDDAYSLVVDRRSLLLAAVFVFMFTILMLLIADGRKLVRQLPLVLFVVLGLELVVMNWDTLYARTYVTKQDFDAAAGDYGIDTAMEQIQSQDDSLYRISATEDSNYANAGALLGFPAASVYSNTNSAMLSSFAKFTGTSELSANHFVCDGTEFAQLQLLSGKYAIRNNSGRSCDQLPDALYEMIGTTPDGTKTIYKVREAIPFGYLYTKAVQSEDFSKVSLPKRMFTLLQACVIDGEGKTVTNGLEVFDTFALPKDLERTDLISSGTDANQLTLTEDDGVTTFTPDGPDPYLYYEVGKSREGAARVLYIRLSGTSNYSNIRRMQVYYMSDGDEGPDPLDYQMFTIQRGYPEAMILLPDDVTSIRLDFPEDFGSTKVRELSVLSIPNAASCFTQLADTNVTDIRMEGGSYHATVTAEADGIFCIPVLMTNWTATVNGSPSRITSVNGGLTGIEVPAGTSEITLTYNTSRNHRAARISMISFLVWILLFVPTVIKRHKKNELT